MKEGRGGERGLSRCIDLGQIRRGIYLSKGGMFWGVSHGPQPRVRARGDMRYGRILGTTGGPVFQLTRAVCIGHTRKSGLEAQPFAGCGQNVALSEQRIILSEFC